VQSLQVVDPVEPSRGPVGLDEQHVLDWPPLDIPGVALLGRASPQSEAAGGVPLGNALAPHVRDGEFPPAVGHRLLDGARHRDVEAAGKQQHHVVAALGLEVGQEPGEPQGLDLVAPPELDRDPKPHRVVLALGVALLLLDHEVAGYRLAERVALD